MAQKKVRQAVKFFLERLLEQNVNVSKVILLGYQAAATDGDIGIAVVSQDFRRKSIFKRLQLIKNPEIQTIRKFLVPLDVLLMTPEEYDSRVSIIAAYARKGEALYAA